MFRVSLQRRRKRSRRWSPGRHLRRKWHLRPMLRSRHDLRQVPPELVPWSVPEEVPEHESDCRAFDSAPARPPSLPGVSRRSVHLPALLSVCHIYRHRGFPQFRDAGEQDRCRQRGLPKNRLPRQGCQIDQRRSVQRTTAVGPEVCMVPFRCSEAAKSVSSLSIGLPFCQRLVGVIPFHAACQLPSNALSSFAFLTVSITFLASRRVRKRCLMRSRTPGCCSCY
jgi:hypothetical protein